MTPKSPRPEASPRSPCSGPDHQSRSITVADDVGTRPVDQVRGVSIGILQPVYLPWMGYFEQIASVDLFVILDNVQYTHQDWRNRNRIKGPDGPIWLTVPIHRRPLASKIHEIEINDEHRWRRRHLMSIRQSYGRCPFFEPVFSQLEEVLLQPHTHLVDLDLALISLICEYLGISTPILRSSDLSAQLAEPPRRASHTTAANARLISLCRLLRASVFYEGARGKNYLDVGAFRAAGISVVFQEFAHPKYPQRYGDFLPQLSIIDLIMNVGPESRRLIEPNPAVRRASEIQGSQDP